MLHRTTAFLKKERLLVLLAGLTALFRVPSLFEPLWYGDEGVYLTIGQQILRGDLLYVDIFDNKPPLLYYLTAGSLAVFGHSVAAIKALLFGWSLASLFVFYFLARRLLDKAAALLAVALFSFLVTPTWLEGNIVGSEILMILPACGGVLLGLNRRFFLAGFSFGLAVLLKVPAIFDFGAFFIFVALSVERGGERRTASDLARLGGGLLAPAVVTVGYFAADGALDEYFDSVFLSGVDYTSSEDELLFSHGRLVLNALPVLLLVAGLAARTLRRWQKAEANMPSPFEFIVLWLMFSFYGALLGGRPYEHYLIQAAPPFALLAAFVLTRADDRRFLGAGALLAVAAIALDRDFDLDRRSNLEYYQNFIEYAAGGKGFDEYADHLDGRTAGNYRVSEFVREDTSGSDASLYMFSDQPAIYFLSHLEPASRYVVYYHLNWEEDRKPETLRALTEQRPRYIVGEQPPIGEFPELERMIAEDYRLIGSEGILRIYKRGE